MYELKSEARKKARRNLVRLGSAAERNRPLDRCTLVSSDQLFEPARPGETGSQRVDADFVAEDRVLRSSRQLAVEAPLLDQAAANVLDMGLANLQRPRRGVDRIVPQHQFIGMRNGRSDHELGVILRDELDRCLAALEDDDLAMLQGVRRV